MALTKITICLFTVLLLVNNTLAIDCKAADNCATCNSQVGKCIKCSPNHALQNGRCTQPSNGVQNCETYYNNDVNKCVICKPGFQNNYDDTACGISFTLDQQTVISAWTAVCGTDCRTCRVSSYEITAGSSDESKCLVCITGAGAEKKGGGKKCSSVTGTLAAPLITNCLYEYGSKSYCYQCKEGFIMSADRKTCTTHGLNTHVKNCIQLDITGNGCKVCGTGNPMINDKLCQKGNLILVSALVVLVASFMWY